MSNEAGARRAMLIEKANVIKNKIREIDQLAGSDDKIFRKMILKYFQPEKIAQ